MLICGFMSRFVRKSTTILILKPSLPNTLQTISFMELTPPLFHDVRLMYPLDGEDLTHMEAR